LFRRCNRKPVGRGRPYSALGDWSIRSRIKRVLHARATSTPRFKSAASRHVKMVSVSVVLEVAVNAGPVFHISSIAATADRCSKQEPVAILHGETGRCCRAACFRCLGAELAAFYRHSGYADVDVEVQPTLDREHAWSPTPGCDSGPVYHLRSVAIKNLDAPQENRVRELLG